MVFFEYVRIYKSEDLFVRYYVTKVKYRMYARQENVWIVDSWFTLSLQIGCLSVKLT